MMRVKICGMQTLDDVRTSVEAGADALGFIFAASPRRLSLDEGRAQQLTAVVPAFVTTVGVFANDPEELVRQAIASCRLDVLQFCGDESVDFCGSFGKPTIVAVRSRRYTLEQLADARATAVLVDALLPGRFGGTGTIVESATFLRARNDHDGVSAILAGGLTPSNVAELIRSAKPDAVDVRSGVERHGQKDPQLVRAFVAAARSAMSDERR